MKKCRRCGSDIDQLGNCEDETCPFSDCQQDDPKGWIGHPQEAEMTQECECGHRVNLESSLKICDNCKIEAASKEHAIDTHSVNCCVCGQLADGRECIDGVDDSGEPGQVCSHCQDQDNPAWCPSSKDRRHKPDFASVGSAEIVQEPNHWIFDVACKHCGHSGAFRCDPTTEIDW